MIKLIIQIPCFNEEETLGITLAALPRELSGIDIIEWLIIDDGSKDNTVEVARANKVDHIVLHHKNMGLAKAFMTGIKACLEKGADIIVNTDADNQYCADDIPKLIDPILTDYAEIVVGARLISEMEDLSNTKKILQKFGSWTVRVLSNTDIQDAPSGFRAISRNAAMKLNVFSDYTYTLETIIQAGQKGLAIISVPIRTNRKQRPSRLIKNTPSYIRRSILTIARVFLTYRPFRFFMVPGTVFFSIGLIIGIRFLFAYFMGNGSGHIQSLILAALLLGSGFFLCIVGLLADLISVNRKLLENLNRRMYQIEARLQKD